MHTQQGARKYVATTSRKLHCGPSIQIVQEISTAHIIKHIFRVSHILHILDHVALMSSTEEESVLCLESVSSRLFCSALVWHNSVTTPHTTERLSERQCKTTAFYSYIYKYLIWRPLRDFLTDDGICHPDRCAFGRPKGFWDSEEPFGGAKESVARETNKRVKRRQGRETNKTLSERDRVMNARDNGESSGAWTGWMTNGAGARERTGHLALVITLGKTVTPDVIIGLNRDLFSGACDLHHEDASLPEVWVQSGGGAASPIWLLHWPWLSWAWPCFIKLFLTPPSKAGGCGLAVMGFVAYAYKPTFPVWRFNA